ncbi:synaptoporin-like [Diorhabda sublineata]|uniref:synaptoporin-like n=1 Tax=Diorhabda sublineata TaxID=1163346 RepID=UPI0024E17489|nr:synaptoporin-like [Diorhabda sublineata]
MDLNLSVFQEPRGVMRVLHFIFSICAFATITGYTGYLKSGCIDQAEQRDSFSYPFEIIITKEMENKKFCNVTIAGDFSSDAKFFVTSGVLAMLYSLAIIFVYIKMDKTYKSDTKAPLIDFMVTVLLSVLWLSSSAAWANGLTGLKSETNPHIQDAACKDCYFISTSFSSLNISVIFGFLNFFLWAADLWFIYKETSWFQGNQRQTDGV